MEEANLSEINKANYVKLHASREDIYIARSCAKYIKIKGWHTYPFLRRGSVRIQQFAFTTTMIIAYVRPFAQGRGNIDFPKRMIASYGSDEKKLHAHLLRLRNEEYAHSDASTYSVTPYKSGSIICIESIRDVRFTAEQIDLFLLMTDGLLDRITERVERLRLGN